MSALGRSVLARSDPDLGDAVAFREGVWFLKSDADLVARLWLVRVPVLGRTQAPASDPLNVLPSTEPIPREPWVARGLQGVPRSLASAVRLTRESEIVTLPVTVLPAFKKPRGSSFRIFNAPELDVSGSPRLPHAFLPLNGAAVRGLKVGFTDDRALVFCMRLMGRKHDNFYVHSEGLWERVPKRETGAIRVADSLALEEAPPFIVCDYAVLPATASEEEVRAASWRASFGVVLLGYGAPPSVRL